MSYGRVCDTLYAHRKVARAGLEALGLWTVALSWSRAKATGGRIPADRPALLVDDPEVAARCVAALVAARLWDLDGDGWRFHDWDDHQESEADEAARKAEIRAMRAELGRRGGLASGVVRVKLIEANRSKGSKGFDLEANEAPIPIPIPIPTRSQPGGEGSAEGGSAPAAPPPPISPGKGQDAAIDPPEAPPPVLTPPEPAKPPRRGRKPAAGKHPLPAEWAPDLAARQLAAELGVDVLLEAEKMRAWAAHEGAVGKAWDQRFSNWIHAAAERKRSNGSTGAHKIANVQPTPATGPAWKPKSVTDLRPEAERIAHPLDAWGNETQ